MRLYCERENEANSLGLHFVCSAPVLEYVHKNKKHKQQQQHYSFAGVMAQKKNRYNNFRMGIQKKKRKGTVQICQ